MKAHVLTGDDTVSKVVTKKAALSYGYPVLNLPWLAKNEGLTD